MRVYNRRLLRELGDNGGELAALAVGVHGPLAAQATLIDLAEEASGVRPESPSGCDRAQKDGDARRDCPHRRHFDFYLRDRARIRVLEQRLGSAIKRAGAGELGETEYHLDGNDGYLYMYGPDPDRLYQVVSPLLKSSKLMTGAEVTKHYGSRTESFVVHRAGMQ
jgi:hypothetical protein